MLLLDRLIDANYLIEKTNELESKVILLWFNFTLPDGLKNHFFIIALRIKLFLE